MSLGFWVIHTFFTEVNVKLHSKDVAFYFFFCVELFSGLGFLKVFGGVSATNTTYSDSAIARVFWGDRDLVNINLVYTEKSRRVGRVDNEY